MAQTVLISFGNQKGGVSKSTLTVLLALYIYYETEYSVAVVDGDNHQRTIAKLRESDLKNGAEEDKVFPLFECSTRNFTKFYQDTLYGNFDFVFIDLPGNMLQPGVVSSYVPVDILLCPFNLNKAETDATGIFLKDFKQVDQHRSEKGFNPTEKYAVLSRIDNRTSDAKKLEDIKSGSPISVLNNYFPYRPKYGSGFKTYLENKDIFDKETKALCEEIFALLKAKHNEVNVNVKA